MPLYDFECDNCKKIVEEFFTMDECPTFIKCRSCKAGIAKKVIIRGHGGSFDDHPRWLDDEVRGALQDTDRVAQKLEKPIETRSEHKQFLERNNLVEVG